MDYFAKVLRNSMSRTEVEVEERAISVVFG